MKKYHYDKENNLIYINVKEGKEDKFEEIIPGINLELDENDDIIGVEIQKASKFFKQKKIKTISK